MGVTLPVGRQPTVLKWQEIRGTGNAAMRLNWVPPYTYRPTAVNGVVLTDVASMPSSLHDLYVGLNVGYYDMHDL